VACIQISTADGWRFELVFMSTTGTGSGARAIWFLMH